MPFTSTQISGLVGGQQVMFANQATFANQIAGEGGSQQMMANPYPSPSYGVAGLDPASPDIGTKIAGGMGMAIPGIAAGGSMAASLLGYKSPLGLLDPFTGISRAFGAGTGGGLLARGGVMAGTQGMGISYAASNISGAFASGGLRAGLGAIGGGLAGAAVAAVPYYIAGKAIEYAGRNIYEGAQNFQDVRRMTSEYMGPQYGQPGAGLGGRPAAGMIKNITSFMHEIASEDVMTSMKDMRQLMDRAGSMGMLQGIQDVNQFKQRFRDIVKQTKGVAQILGTTLQEALPLVGQLQQMGMWTAKDVLGTAAGIKAAGPGGAQAMMGAMQQGAQMSYAMGGKLESGARLGQELFNQVSAATRVGTFSSQDIRNMTGGVGGVEGQRMVAGSMQQVMAGFGQTAMGRLMMAGLGQVKNNEFTGRMDEQLLAKFQRGEISVGELQGMGQRRIQSNKSLATSFFNRADELGQAMGEQGGMAAQAMGIQQAMQRAGYGNASAPIQNRFIQMITGANQRQADMIQKIIKDLPRIMAEQERANEAALEDSFRQLDERRNNSIAGLKDAVGKAFYEGTGRPLQELGEQLTSSMSEATQRFTEKIYGRTRAIPRLGMEQRLMLAQAGAVERGPVSLEAMGIQNVGQRFMQGGAMENLIGRVGEEGFGTRLMTGIGVGAGIGAVAGAVGAIGVGALPGAVIGGIAGGITVAAGGFEEDTPRQRALRAAGLRTRPGETGPTSEDAERVARRAYIRTVDPTMGGLFGGETEEKRSAMEKVKAKMRQVYNDPKTASRLAQLREQNPEKQFDEISRLLGDDPETKKALRLLERSTPGGIGAVDATMDVVAGAQAELGYTGKHAVDFQKMTKGLSLPSDPKEVEEFRQKNIDMMTETAGGFGFGGLMKAVGIGAGVGFATPIPGGAILGGIVEGLRYAATRGTSQADIEAAMASKQYLPQDIAEWAAAEKSGEKLEGNRFAEALSKGDDSANKIAAFYRGATEEERARFTKGLAVESQLKDNQFHQERMKKMKAAAEAQGPMVAIKGLRGEVTRGLESARKSFAAGDVSSGEAAIARLAETGGLKQREIDLLLSGRGGAAGVQVGRLASIRGMGEMNAEQVQRKLGNLGGVNFLADEKIAGEVERMLASGGKISGSEVKQLKDMLLAAAPGALGQGTGAGARTSAQEAQEKYITAMSNFTNAVNKIVVVDKKDVENAPGEVVLASMPQ